MLVEYTLNTDEKCSDMYIYTGGLQDMINDYEEYEEYDEEELSYYDELIDYYDSYYDDYNDY